MELKTGQVVKSLAGRDKGRLYLIIGFAGNRTLLADGRCRTVGNPKKKNPKHLQPYRSVFPEIKESIRQGKLKDIEVRNILNNFLCIEDDNAEVINGSPRNSSSDGC